ncbi:tRNA (adenosine(37)-N6)-threonylcarbamoyltransferase complex transferase subunit TsaD, partial [candidate division NPL-UPA2 bacterium]|nr:tRNA (adenosine(37)-N6)-threonylcarbamoyltransferase complex transferase subunit TsaD [candidate division NPL-UPA2 bacterium]
AKSLSYVYNSPLIGVNHLEGHIHSASLNYSVHPPFVSLIASGGHTSLIFVKGDGDYELLGATRDDAAGEAYDKVAKLLGLGYPGGPVLDKLAQKGDKDKIKFPRPYLPDSFDFSFSGLKTAVLYYLRDKKLPALTLPYQGGGVRGRGQKRKFLHNRVTGDGLQAAEIADIAASFQAAVVDVLAEKSLRTVKGMKVKTLVVGGGVTANHSLRKVLRERAKESEIEVYMPSPDLATDNAAMVAAAGYYRLRQGQRSDALTLNAVANLSF